MIQHCDYTPALRPVISATTLFRRLAPPCAREVSGQLYRLGIVNSDDLLHALATGVQHFAAEQDLRFSADFRTTWPEALQYLRTGRSEADWARLVPQTDHAPQAAAHKVARGASQMVQVLEAARETAGLSPRRAVTLGGWCLTAVVIAQVGPRDAEAALKDLAATL
ncbi:hypothetical protein [Aquicoccus sp. SU-CL01552]|uniref:hypothetical protein n=1 Tax=Aquicoccus sp. SU-CL01552 TaxID=3127656 RepID=UPI003105C3CB